MTSLESRPPVDVPDDDEVFESRSWEGLVLVAMITGAALVLLGVYALVVL